MLFRSLTSVWRARRGTSPGVSTATGADKFNGDGVTTVFDLGIDPTLQAGVAVFVDGALKILGKDYHYTITGIDLVVAPPAGVNNVVVVITPRVGLPTDNVHVIGDTVIDAGGANQFPTGTYQWQPSVYGMLGTNTAQARFLVEGRT